MGIVEQFDVEVKPRYRGQCRSVEVIRRRPRRLRLIGRLVFVAALFAGLAEHVYHSLPSACYRRAIEAIDSKAPQALSLEIVKYELLRLRDSVDFKPHASLLKAKLLLAAKHYAAALEQLKIADSLDETRLRALVLAGETFYRAGLFRDACHAWAQALEIDPGNIDALRWLGVAYYELGSYHDAIYCLSEVANRDTSDPRPHRVIGVIWRDLDEFNDAAEAFRESLRRDSTSALSDRVRFELAQVLSWQQDHAEALEVLQPLEPNVEVLTIRAASLYGVGQMDEAAELLDRVIAESPQHFPALVTRTKIALERSEYDLAAQLAARAGRIKPKNLEALGLLIATHLKHGERQEAKQSEKILQEVTDQLDAYHKVVSKASNDATDSELRYRSGVLALDLGLDDAARWWLRACVFLDPDHQAARELLSKLNDGQGAVESLQ